ncbi:MAG: hypothetical protein Q4D98_09755 [Planctomycetia bacterium]|nr:hypothetical protein [Planctomycetia bacterium]
MKTVWMSLLGLFVCGGIVLAQEKAKSPEEQLAAYAEMGPGVYNVKTNEKGEIISLIVVGRSRISTVLGVGKGEEIARNRALLDSDARFVEWCKTNLTVQESASDETIIVLKGENEEGKATEITLRKVESHAAGTLRGMQLLYAHQDGEGKFFTVIKGLNVQKVNAVKKLTRELDSDATQEEAASEAEEAPAKPDVKTKTVVAPGAEEFL